MPLQVPTDLWLAYAKIAQYLWANDVSRQTVFKGRTIAPKYDQWLYMVRSTLETQYNRYLVDNSITFGLNEVSEYLYALIGKYQSQAASIYGGICIPPQTLSNPTSQSINVGDSFVFLENATGTNLTYQWKLNGVNISGATSSIYQKTNAQLSDAGTYQCVVSNACGTISSTTATLTVTSSLRAYWLAMDTDPFPTINGGSDPYTYPNSVSFVHNAAITFPVLDADANKYGVFKIPKGEPVKTAYSFPPLNSGTIPSPTFQSVITSLPLYDYYVSRNTLAYDPGSTLILS